MERRNAIKLAVGALSAGGIGALALTHGFKPEIATAKEPKKLDSNSVSSDYKYVPLDPKKTAEKAYQNYPKGSCMYGVFSSVVEQLAEKLGEPFSSFPIQMMKYGHGGVNGYGTICGTLNGASALFGLLINDKKAIDALALELFRMYEETPLPKYNPTEPAMDYTPPTSESKSVLCHASTTRWCKKAEHTIGSKERKERCRRLTADIAAQTVTMLNDYFSNSFIANAHDNESVRTCTTCHGPQGKVANTSVKMDCNSCHEESLPHRFLSDVHYKTMDKR